MRLLLAALVVASIAGCGSKRDNGDGDGGTGNADACVGLQCRVVDCNALHMPNTTVSGTAYAPNGTLPLYGVTVYVPNLDPPMFADGVHCDRCEPQLPGEPVTRGLSDESGHFTLDNVPSGTDIPLIVTVGKWRRRALIPSIQQCTDNPLPASLTSLPKNRLEGELPKIAISTGGCDALECLVRKLGVADGEFSSDSGQGHIHLFTGVGGGDQLANTQMFSSATTLTGTLDKLKQYDMALFSCECSQNPTTKPQSAMDNLKAFADLGGRVFLSHYHNIWIAGETGVPTHAPAVWPGIATCAVDTATSGTDIIDQVNNPKGTSFANWMVNVQGSTTLGQVSIDPASARQTCNAIDSGKAERWVYFPSGIEYPQIFQFTTPNEMPADQRCGRVVFSDMHVASGSFSSPGPTSGFPNGCSTAPMTPQEKALAFMLFDIASCVPIIQ
jgi:hypothetical protein